MPGRPVTQKITYTSTSTGSSTGVAYFGTGMSNASAHHVISGTTKAYTFTLQGSVGASNLWTNICAATTGSTGGTLVNSTVAMSMVSSSPRLPARRGDSRNPGPRRIRRTTGPLRGFLRRRWFLPWFHRSSLPWFHPSFPLSWSHRLSSHRSFLQWFHP